MILRGVQPDTPPVVKCRFRDIPPNKEQVTDSEYAIERLHDRGWLYEVGDTLCVTDPQADFDYTPPVDATLRGLEQLQKDRIPDECTVGAWPAAVTIDESGPHSNVIAIFRRYHPWAARWNVRKAW